MFDTFLSCKYGCFSLLILLFSTHTHTHTHTHARTQEFNTASEMHLRLKIRDKIQLKPKGNADVSTIMESSVMIFTPLPTLFAGLTLSAAESPDSTLDALWNSGGIHLLSMFEWPTFTGCQRQLRDTKELLLRASDAVRTAGRSSFSDALVAHANKQLNKKTQPKNVFRPIKQALEQWKGEFKASPAVEPAVQFKMDSVARQWDKVCSY